MTASWDRAFAPKPAGKDAVLVGLLGSGIGASRTPRMHMAEGAALGFACDYRLLDTDTVGGRVDLGALLSRLARVGYDGINVTFPYKQQIMPHLDALAESARAAGAVNTVLFRDGRTLGENTDCWGFRESLRRGLPDAPRETVLLLGAGGAGGAVAAALVSEGAGRLLVADSDRARAEALAARFPGRAAVVADLAEAAARADGIVNATPVGMAKLPGMPIPGDLVAPRHWVADIVYFPLETALLAHARAKGCQVLPGSGMALYQAVRAFELFTGRAPDPQRMWAAFEAGGAEATPRAASG